jgi:predicted small lipoprotein YifL
MSGMHVTPALSQLAGRGRRQPLAPPKQGKGGARVSGRVKDRCNQFADAVIFVALVLALTLAGCGKRNAPQPPPDVPDTYPRPYPSE